MVKVAQLTVSSAIMTPLERYRQDLQRDDFYHDAAQEMAVWHLQRLYNELLEQRARPRPGLLGRLGRRLTKRDEKTVKGLYFWGGVGRGKTYLMDAFYDSLPFCAKTRIHFHRFMQRVHAELHLLTGQKNPLDHVSRTLASEADVICFDEFYVSDITDAMLLGGLLKKLFGHGVVLVATSNIRPDRLYENGTQRELFLPTIDLLNRHTEVVNVDGGIDYRLRTLQQAELYHSPLDSVAEESLARSYESLAPDPQAVVNGQILEINGRPVHSRSCCEDVVWFEFAALCGGPRSQNDYIEIARQYHTVLISNLPRLGDHIDDQARRFISLVDEFYDCGVKLILSAEVPLSELYGNGPLKFEFKRTTSRLMEMQSLDYLARQHKA